MSIINGFRTTGIYDPEPEIQGPNKRAISESIFSVIDLEKYKKQLAEKAIEATVTSPQEPEPPVIEEVLPPTANPEVPLTEEPELPSVANTVQQLSTSDLQQTSTSKRTFEELLLDLCKNNNTTPGKPIKRKKIVHTCEIITTEKYLQMKLNE